MKGPLVWSAGFSVTAASSSPLSPAARAEQRSTLEDEKQQVFFTNVDAGKRGLSSSDVLQIYW